MKTLKAKFTPKFLKEYIDNSFAEFIEFANSAISSQNNPYYFSSDKSLKGLNLLTNKDVVCIENHRAAYGNDAFQIIKATESFIKVMNYYEVNFEVIEP